tara:strand:+ start:50054 stop:51385 length:1332 start_codon:yes stop_codon:yes gene_type:complete
MHLLTVLALRILMTLLFCVGLLRVIADGPELVLTGVILLIAYLVLSVLAGRCRSDTMIISFVVGALALAITLYTGHWSVLYDGVAFALIFTFFLPAIQFVRATVQASPEVGQSRQAFEQMKEGERTGGMFLGAHVLGSALIIGAYPILAPLVPADADLAERARAARTNCRGTSLVLYWSPFTVGMAFVLTAWPDLPLWQIVAAGFPLSAIGLLLGVTAFGPPGAARGVKLALIGFGPLILPLGTATIIVTAIASLTTLGTIRTVAIFMPLLCLGWVIFRLGGKLRPIMHSAWDGLDGLGNDLLLFSSAMMLGKAIEASGVLDLLLTNEIFMSLPPMLVVGVLMLLSLLAAMMTLHPIVTAAVFVPILQGFEPGLAPLVAGLVLLYAWMCGSMLALSSLSVVLAARVYNVPAKGIAYGRNLSYMAGLGVISFVLLCGLEYVLGG